MRADASGPNLVTLFFDQVENLRDKPFLWSKSGGQYWPMSWTQVSRQVSALARALRAEGVKPGDRVVLAAENRPEWVVADFAIMAAGAITVPAYVTNTSNDHKHVLSDSGAVAAICSTREIAANLLPAAAEIDLPFVVAVEDWKLEDTGQVKVLPWKALIEQGEDGHDNIIEGARAIRLDDVACLIYTSGTGGVPKGVMLTHRNLLHNVRAAQHLLDEFGLEDEVFLSFLPLSHSYEHLAGHFFPVSIGAQIYYAEDLGSLATNMQEARPTIMTAVPRLYEMLHARITAGVRKEGGTKQQFFGKALELGLKKLDGEKLGVFERVQDAAVDSMVRDKVRARFGGRLKALVSGGAALNPEIGRFFTALGLRLLQGYGQTESAPLISCNRPNSPKIHTVGPPALDVDVRIAEDGEILARGDMVMKGYWGREEDTASVIKDGWLHTGDIGTFDEDGHLMITDRKKDIIVNSGGDNISPARIEGIIAVEPEIHQVMVYGDKKPHLVALVVPDPDWLKGWAKDNEKPNDLQQLADDDDLRKALQAVIDKVNPELSVIERVRRISVSPTPFTIENEMMTPTMKARRHVVKAAFDDRLEALYGGR
ncbi:MAG: AMP-dependent synthetase/ligase [Magnetovibrionaceae bacterium]